MWSLSYSWYLDFQARDYPDFLQYRDLLYFSLSASIFSFRTLEVITVCSLQRNPNCECKVDLNTQRTWRNANFVDMKSDARNDIQ